MFAVGAALLAACGPGSGDDTPAPPSASVDVDAFSRPVDGLDDEELARFEAGKAVFEEAHSTLDAGGSGFGPRFNAVSCASCHERDGRAAGPDDDGVLQGSGLVLALDPPDPRYGRQLQDGTVGELAAEGEVEVVYESLGRTLPDGTVVTLRAPVYSIGGLSLGPLDPVTGLSPRIAPVTSGTGLLEAVPATVLAAAADPDDADGDGVSGRVGRGRFGWRAESTSVEEQTARALALDLGLSTSQFAGEDCTAADREGCDVVAGTPEVDGATLADLVFYVRTLGAPPRRGAERDDVVAGEQLFTEIGCAACHTATLRTGPSDVGALAHRAIHPYTDLLVHDLGAGLADTTGREWRTPPLWGLGRIEEVNGHTTLLHDGRARDVGEAILWHGGEALPAEQRFERLTREERDELVVFLTSL